MLIKAVAQAIPTYSMGCFKLPRGLCQHINLLIRKFWWGNTTNGRRKTNWVAWEKLIQPKFMGGLGFRDIELFDLALLARQAWRILQNPMAMTAQLSKVVYYPACDFLQAPLGSRPSQVWRALIEGRDVLKQGLIRRIGSGKETKVWEDNWIPCSGLLRPVA